MDCRDFLISFQNSWLPLDPEIVWLLNSVEVILVQGHFNCPCALWTVFALSYWKIQYTWHVRIVTGISYWRLRVLARKKYWFMFPFIRASYLSPCRDAKTHPPPITTETISSSQQGHNSCKHCLPIGASHTYPSMIKYPKWIWNPPQKKYIYKYISIIK